MYRYYSLKKYYLRRKPALLMIQCRFESDRLGYGRSVPECGVCQTGAYKIMYIGARARTLLVSYLMSFSLSKRSILQRAPVEGHESSKKNRDPNSLLFVIQIIQLSSQRNQIIRTFCRIHYECVHIYERTRIPPDLVVSMDLSNSRLSFCSVFSSALSQAQPCSAAMITQVKELKRGRWVVRSEFIYIQNSL